MDKDVNKNYTNVYQAMNQTLKYYKKYSQQPVLNEDDAIKQANELIISSQVPSFMTDLIFAVQNQIGREINQCQDAKDAEKK